MRRPVSCSLPLLVLAGCIGPGTTPTTASAPAENVPGTPAELLGAVRTAAIGAAGSLTGECHRDEDRLVTVDRAVLHPLRDALKSANAAGVAALGGPDLVVSGFPAQAPSGTATPAFEQAAWPKPAGGAVPDALAAYLAQFSTIEDVQFDTWSLNGQQRDAKSDFARATLDVGFDVRGIDAQGWRRNDRGRMQVVVEKTASKWSLVRAEVTQGETVRAATPAFTDVTAATGLDKVPTYQRIEAIRRGGYSIAAADYDKDGHTDLYVGAWGAGTLLKGDGSGSWTPVENAGLKGETLVKTSLFADLDNDGWEDLFLVRFTPDDSKDLVYYKNNQGTFADAGEVFTGRVPTGYAMPAAMADFNKDGFLDVYVGYPGAKDFTVLESIKQDRAVQGMLLNDGKGGFSDRTSATFSGTQPDTLFAHSAMAVDYDGDLDSDLVVIDDRGGLSPVYQNRGDGTFVQVAKEIGVGNEGFGMGIANGDIDGDGDDDFVMTNVDFVATHRFVDSCATNWHVNLPRPLQRGLRAFENVGGGVFREITDTAGLAWAGEGLGGAEFFDYDNDGHLDLYVSTGLWSGTTPDQDLSSLFTRAYMERTAWGEAAALLTYQPEKDRALKSWYREQTEAPAHRMEGQSTFMKVLQTYQGDLEDVSTTGGTERPSMAGFERNRLFRNDGTGHFVEVGYLAGVDSLADGYVAARVDYDRDGRMDLVLRNADPGTLEHTFAPVQVFHNQTPNANSLVLDLEGSASNRDGVGAWVTVTAGGQTMTSQLLANNGTSQSEKVVHVGLGDAKVAASVLVRWPSGTTQELRDVPAGRLVVREAEAKNRATAAN